MDNSEAIATDVAPVRLSVCLSLCLSVGHDHELRKTTELIEMSCCRGRQTCVGPRNQWGCTLAPPGEYDEFFRVRTAIRCDISSLEA